MGWIHTKNVTDEEWLQNLDRKTSWKQKTWKIKKSNGRITQKFILEK